MQSVRIGKTELIVNKNGFGALPIQRTDMRTAKKILKRAYSCGINFFDTARMYSDSEEKVGKALRWHRSKVIIASKTAAKNSKGFWKDLEKSLHCLKTGYIDIYQFHNPDFCPRPGDESGLYDAMLQAKKEGKIRHIGITNHRLSVAKEAIESGLYETLQFPFSYLSTDKEIELVEMCEKADMGFIAMKALSGGLIKDSRAAYAYMGQFKSVEPIWGIQTMKELEEFLSYQESLPEMTMESKAVIEKDREELQGEFCRGCGYCMPCPVGIEINNCARRSLLLRRSPLEGQLTPKVQGKMKKIEECIHCNQCKEKCPYGLDTPELLKRNYEDYKTFLK